MALIKSFYRWLIFAGCMVFCFTLYAGKVKAQDKKIIIENKEMRLVLGTDGKALSLVHKPTGKECLQQGLDISAFSVTQYTPYEDELQLALPSKPTTFVADSVARVGDDLVVNFERVNTEVTIGLKITDVYIGFTLKKIDHRVPRIGDHLKPPVDEVTILQLPVRDRGYFGEWLNVVWDKDVAVNVLASGPYTRIDAMKHKGYYLLQAGALSEIKSLGVGAALITTRKDDLLDRIDRLEQDYNLPRGVQSRRSREYKYSYLQVADITTQNVDEYIAYAKKAGFHAIQITWTAFAKTMGHFPWRPEYPNGMADLQLITRKIKDAGMLAGANLWYTKAHKNDLYVSPVPDPRLNLRTVFTLAAGLDKTETTVTVEENPANCTLDEGRRILKIGDELIEYKSFTTVPPYSFTGCTRGILNTRSSAYGTGYKLGLLDVDWPTNWVRFDQRTSIQKEIAERIAKIYNEAGFQFCYFNGADDVHAPYWYYVSAAQLKLYDLLDPVPLFSEAASRSHFSWHMITRGNAFGGFAPEVVKEATRKYPAAEARYIAPDLTSINFGFIRNVPPGSSTIGLQPDMVEYICSRGAAWNSPISVSGNLSQLKAHPRTNDNLDLMRRWEEARISNFFTAKQKRALQDLRQEHTLLLNENGKFELHPYEQIQDVAGGRNEVRAFIFRRSGKTYITYWHTSGKGNIKLGLPANKVKLFKELTTEIPVQVSGGYILIPADERRYLQVDMPLKEAVAAFQTAEII